MLVPFLLDNWVVLDGECVPHHLITTLDWFLFLFLFLFVRRGNCCRSVSFLCFLCSIFVRATDEGAEQPLAAELRARGKLGGAKTATCISCERKLTGKVGEKELAFFEYLAPENQQVALNQLASAKPLPLNLCL